jgi:hypothetical protein
MNALLRQDDGYSEGGKRPKQRPKTAPSKIANDGKERGTSGRLDVGR